ncbi:MULTISPECIES: DUF2269 domain-containing protein [unclassified Rhizobacter]|uniref:DUF2269 family protein n=1 Tax=unclassified Rhizobacter TaxID=2640088 RepID=UPI0006FA9CC9|nr:MULTISPECIES: DUF2269 domain-containing protein [unclassified Rhizobacter]KQU71434.1 hypothetical protein ASC88_06725 [Rhizobacter sp. Root29]KQW13077.1 hypothetical protein ASC98_18780 [Rhizobacter sp. Root1238]
MEYLIAKWLHILSSTVLFGTGIGSAFHMLLASLSRNPQACAVVVRQVVLADWLFTTTTIVFQPLSGLYLAHLAGVPLTTPWILWSFVLYLVAGACWLPVVWIQIRMRALAQAAADSGEPLSPAYFRMLRWWTALGVPAFAALTLVFYLMVAKPA